MLNAIHNKYNNQRHRNERVYVDIYKLSCPRCCLSHTVEYEPGFCDDEADVDEPSDEWAYDIFAHARDSVRRLVPLFPPH